MCAGRLMLFWRVRDSEAAGEVDLRNAGRSFFGNLGAARARLGFSEGVGRRNTQSFCTHTITLNSLHVQLLVVLESDAKVYREKRLFLFRCLLSYAMSTSSRSICCSIGRDNFYS